MTSSESAGCNFCGSQKRRFVMSGPDRMVFKPGIFTFYECENCGLLYQHPQLPWSQLAEYYVGPEYDSYATVLQDEASPLSRSIKRLGFIKQRRYIEQFCPSGSLVDVGCGSGLFLEEMQLSGRWQLSGVEPTISQGEYVRQRLNIPVQLAPLEEVDIPPNSQDIVTMWNVLEHLADPSQAFSKCWEMLKPGGHFIFAIPSPESIGRQVFGPYWVGWELPRHLFAFPQKALTQKLNASGFQVVDRACFMITYFTFGNSLKFWLQTWSPNYRPIANLIERLYYSPIGRILFAPIQLVLEGSKKASVVTWAVQKQR